MAIRRFVAGLVVVLGLGGSVFAQVPGQYANEESSLLVWGVLAGAGLIICATGFMNAKRSHLN